MFITDRTQLKKYNSENRLWQGIPGIAVTPKGRTFLTFYSGGTKEQIGNFAVLLKADRDEAFGEPIAAAFWENHRCYDPCLWLDPLGRLWFMWACAPDHAVYAVICDDPDAEELLWSGERIIGKDVMMNKPTVLSTGEWLFPMAVWDSGIRAVSCEYDSQTTDRGSFVYKTVDNGVSFTKYGKAEVKRRSFDEHMVLEFRDGSLGMYVRTFYGIGVSYSFDQGKTWTEGVDSGLGGPCSRFFIRRLKSGRILLINHYHYKGRNNLTALLSEDECKTWQYSLVLDERDNVSYPDAVEDENGYIHITYDRERGAFETRLEDTYAQAREILIAKITENDIMAGRLVDDQSFLKKTASKLGKYALEHENPYFEIGRFSDKELVKYLADRSPDKIIPYLFEQYQVNCFNMQKIDSQKLDVLLDNLKTGIGDKKKTLMGIVSLVRSVTDFSKKDVPIVNLIKEKLEKDLSVGVSVEQLAATIGISKYYMCHIFKKTTGISIKAYEKELRLAKAKDYLIHTDKPIADIAGECGYENSCYFSEIFMASEKVTPTQYRKLLKTCSEKDRDTVLYGKLEHVDLLGELTFDNAPASDLVQTYAVSMPSDPYRFLHEPAIIEYHGVLFAAWYNNTKTELLGETPIRFSTSHDLGKTWSEPVILLNDESGKILYCPPVFGIDDDRLYLFANRMVSPDHMHSLDLYVYEESRQTFLPVWSRPLAFKLNTNVYRLPNGKLILPGRIGELDGFPNTPAVLIADNGKIESKWRMVKIQKDGMLPDGSPYVHPEVSLIVTDEKLYAFCRNDERHVPILYVSEDFGETWSAPMSHNIPFSSSKIYSGTLSDRRNYVIGNLEPGRSKLAIFFSEPCSMTFTKEVVLQDGFSEQFGFGSMWHYPCAYESDGSLYVIYSANVTDSDRGAVVSVIDLAKL